jgi:hypothetical protein
MGRAGGPSISSLWFKKEINMSSQSDGIESTRPQPADVVIGEISVGNRASNEEIRRRAYAIHLERGGQSGGELDDWLEAERELTLVALWRCATKLGKDVSYEVDHPQSLSPDIFSVGAFPGWNKPARCNSRAGYGYRLCDR